MGAAERAQDPGNDGRGGGEARRDGAGGDEVTRSDTAERDADARALASTLRLRILRLCLEPHTNREIADRLGMNPATVLHHVRTLVDRGFLVAQPVRRGARGSREVPYLSTRKSWTSPMAEGRTRVLVDTFLEELAQVEDPDATITVRLGLRLSAAAHAELAERLSDLFQELADRPSDPEDAPYSIFFSMHEDVARRGPKD